MRNIFLSLTLIALMALPLTSVFAANEVAIYTGVTQWISKAAADEQAEICVGMLEDAGIAVTWYDSDGQAGDLADWMESATGDDGLDICVLYGDFPPEIYPQGNTQTDGSIAETFIETTDGDTFINHADYMFWGLAGRNREGGLQNMMDIDGIVMWDDDTPMKVTAEGTAISPTLTDYASDRPFHTDQLDGDWEIEVSLAQNDDGTRADPIIVRDGNLGRLIPAIQTANGDEPKGAIAAEIITWLMSTTPVEPAAKLSTTWGALKAVR
ncbi:hypothetical protein C6502_01450 [Candidatus Poribacteria bacterium]|nr:MAG: hypothetical protein C6502_01450 [Candidatus Poribacteria bacterium]